MNMSNVSTKPWKIEYDLYFATVEVELNGMNIVQWWGVSKLTLYSFNDLNGNKSRKMLIAIQHGPHMPVIIFQ